MHRLILRSNQCPGDVVVMTAAVRELHRQYPGQYQTDVRTCAPAIWEHNPHITPIADGDRDARTIEMHYPLINQSNQRPVHFLEGHCEYLAAELGLASLRPQEFRGHIYLSDEERGWRSQVEETTGYRGAFWLVNAGSKNDFTCKQWPLENYQAVIDHFRGRITFVQIGASEHNHPPLSGAIDLRGKTDHRQLIRLVYHSSGVLTGVSYPMHLAAALPLPSGEGRGGGRDPKHSPDSALNPKSKIENPKSLRPCVVLNGGREPPHWEQYPGHQFLHTIGALDCCATGGCWKSRVVRLGDGDHKDRDLCHQPVAGHPRCMRLITPDDVIRAIELFEGSGFGVQGSAPNRRCPIPVLIDFRHGLGDSVQLTTVLLHLRHYHPDWQIDIAAGIGKLPAVGDRGQGTGQREQGTGNREADAALPALPLGDARSEDGGSAHRPELSRAPLPLRVPYSLCPVPSSLPLYRRLLVRGRDAIDRGTYQHVFELAWDECPTSYADSPSTKAEHCLRTVFKLEPIAELCRYELSIGERAWLAARNYLQSICIGAATNHGQRTMENGQTDKFPVVLLHYQANTSTEKKDLPHELARQVCETAIEAGYVTVILDWDKRSPLADNVRIFNPGADSPLWGGIGTGDCEVLAALIAQSSLFIGVDSGPLHVAGAGIGNSKQGTADSEDEPTKTQDQRPTSLRSNGQFEICNSQFAISTPAIAVWTGHHPLHYFCPADHVTHLLPEDHAARLRGDRAIGRAFFHKHYRHRTYRQLDDALPGLVQELLAGDDDGLLRTHGFWVRRDNVEQDLVIVRDIAEQDSYRLAELAVPGPVVVDVGAHIGVFSRAFKQRHPSARIVAVECCPENIPALQRNIGGFAAVVPAALTYDRDVALLNAVYPNCISTGGSTVVPRAELQAWIRREGSGGPEGAPVQGSDADDNAAAEAAKTQDQRPKTEASNPKSKIENPKSEYWLDGRPLATITLERLMAEQGLDRIDVLKLDCEGSEFSILENTTSLDRIGAIVGEYHGRERFMELVSRRFAGWEFRIIRDGDPGTFWLVNRGHREQGTGNREEIANCESQIANFKLPPAGEDGLPSPSLCPVPCALCPHSPSVDLVRGIAVDRGHDTPHVYNDAYFDKYLAYEGTALSHRLGRLRTALVKKHCHHVLDIGIGCGTFLKQWAVTAACCAGCRERVDEKPNKPCGCGGASRAKTSPNGLGYDVNPRAIEWLKERELFADPYNFIPAEVEGLTFWDSLEHLPDPANLLARMRVGMFAFLSLPIFDDLSRLTESRHYRPGEHIWYFTRPGLTRFMAEQGFDLVEANRGESKAGRRSIETFVFRKLRGPALAAGWHRRAIGDALREIVPERPLLLRTANGIGDLCWLMVLAESLKRRLQIPKLTLELQLAGDSRDNRALEFARRFTAVDEVTTARFDIHLEPVGHDARLRYIPNGYLETRRVSEAHPVATKWRDSTAQGNALGEAPPDRSSALKGRDSDATDPYTLILNPWLEWQGRLETFLPELTPQWNVLTDGYRRDPAEIAAAAAYSRRGTLFGQPRTGHITIHLCSRFDNSAGGMNRGGLWSLADWAALLARLRTTTDLPIYILGAQQDADYADELMQISAHRVARLFNLCGQTTATLAIEIIRQSSLMVSFASGLAVAACYLGVPTVAFWNAEGHSISPREQIWFSDSFASNWVPPAMLEAGLYYPAVYGRDSVETVFAAIQGMRVSG